jgi:hypothetical protein
MSILKRQIFIDGSNRQVRFYDWAIVTTTLGSMVEPRNLSLHPVAGREYNPLDMMARIDEIGSIDILRFKDCFFGAGLHGGNQMPQSFHYNE